MTHTPLDLPPSAFGGVTSPPPAIGLAQWFTERARRSGQRLALSYEGRSWTYGDLLADVERLASVLHAGGVRPGMRVAYLGLNHPMFFAALFASARLGAVFVPLNFRLTGAELDYIINDAGVHTLLVGAGHLAVIDSVRANLCCQRHWCAEGETSDARRWPVLADAMAAAPRASGAPAAPANDDVAMIMYTSGTTGRPKGAMLTHGNFWWNHVGELYSVDVLADDRLLVFAPVFHIGGLNVLTLTTLLKGGQVVLHRSFDPARALADIAAHGITIMFSVPAMLLFISQQPGFADAKLGTLRMIMCGGSPCPEPLLHAYKARGIAVQQGYGLTETAALVSVLSAEDAAAKIGSVGRTADADPFAGRGRQ
jgi:fatty-acyl-CoA synthase